jgi:hypothetical protein
MISKALMVITCITYACFQGIAHAQQVEESVRIIQRQLMLLGDATGHDLSGNHLNTSAQQIMDGINAEPEKEVMALKTFCNKLITPEISKQTDRLKKLSQKVEGLSRLLNDIDYKTIVAYPLSLCGLEYDKDGLSKKETDSIASVKAKFNVYFSAVQRKTFEEKLKRFAKKSMQFMSAISNQDSKE